MPSRDLVHSIVEKVSIAAGAAVTTQTTNTGGANSLDTRGYESATIVLRAHTLTAGTIRLYVQDSDDGTTWGALGTADPPTNCIAATQTIGGVIPAALSAAGTLMVGVMDCKRYIRAVVNQVGYSGIFSAEVILGHPKHHGQTGNPTGTQLVV